MPTSLLSLVVVTEFLVFLVRHRRYKRNSSQPNIRLIAMLPHPLHLDSPFSSGPLPLLPFLPCLPDFALEELLQFEQISILVLPGHGQAGIDGISGLFPLLQHLVRLGKSIPSLDVLGIVPHSLGRILTGIAPILEHSMRHGGVRTERRLDHVQLFLGVERSILEGLALLVLFGLITLFHRIHSVGMERRLVVVIDRISVVLHVLRHILLARNEGIVALLLAAEHHHLRWVVVLQTLECLGQTSAFQLFLGAGEQRRDVVVVEDLLQIRLSLALLPALALIDGHRNRLGQELVGVVRAVWIGRVFCVPLGLLFGHRIH